MSTDPSPHSSQLKGGISGTFTFSPSKLAVNAGTLSKNGEFTLQIWVNIKDANGRLIPHEEITMQLLPDTHDILFNKVPTQRTDANGSTTFVMHGKLTAFREYTNQVPFVMEVPATGLRAGSQIHITGKREPY